jgi:acetyl esterase/lipase
MESEMQRGLGADYAVKIPQTMWPRLSRYHWSLLNTLGKRNRSPRATITQDIVYAKPGVRSLKLDVYESQIRPARGDLYPAIITIHPGGWHSRDKGEWFVPHHRYLASQGYVVFDIQYRLSQEAAWPAQLDDVLCALQWVRDHAEQYQVDPDNIALMGRSAGAHLALRAAYDERVSVQAVVALYPPTDLRLWFDSSDSDITELLNRTMDDAPEQYADASPVEQVRDDLPPTLLITGLMDNRVSPVHTATLNNRLRTTNTPVVTLQLPWARHGFDSIMPGLGAQVAQYNIDRFLAWSLYRE